MPTYVYECDAGHTWAEWQSIHAPSHTTHALCGRPCRRVIHSAPFHSSTSAITEVNAREHQWDRDMPAYKRLRDEGFQPPGIDGARELEHRADDEWYIKTGGLVSVPERRRDEINEMLADGQVNPDNWSPVEQVHANRSR